MNKICGKRIVTIFYLYICIFIFVWETALMMLQPIIENQLFWKNRAYKKGNTDVLVGNAHIDFMNDAHVLCLQCLHLSYNFIKIQMEFAYVFISIPLYMFTMPSKITKFLQNIVQCYLISRIIFVHHFLNYQLKVISTKSIGFRQQV